MTKLTDQQQKAVNVPADTHVVLEAVPGAGKTTTLRERIHTLIVDHNIHPSQIVVATFSKSQSEDMARRIFEVYPEWKTTELATGFNGAGQITTLHALARRLVVNYDETLRRRQIAPVYKERKIIEDAVEALNWTINEKPVGWQSILRYINEFKSLVDANEHLLDMSFANLVEWAETRVSTKDAELFARVALDYQKSLERSNMWSFADMLRTCELKMQNDPEFREYWSRQFTHVLVDEGQDTNAQCMRILYWMRPKALFIVGDADQCIFSFLGAAPENNLRTGFDRRYGEKSERHLMTMNFRSHGTLLDRANKLIKYNYNDENKTYMKIIEPRDAQTGPDISWQWYMDPKHEAHQITGEIAERISKGEIGPGNVMIMGRLNAMNANLEIELLRHRLPFVNLGNTSFFDQGVARIIVSYFKLLLDPSNMDAFKDVYNVASREMSTKDGRYCATRYLGEEFLSKVRGSSDLIRAAISNKFAKNEKGWTSWRNGVQDLENTFNFLSEFGASDNAAVAIRALQEYVLNRWVDDQYGVEDDASSSVREDIAIIVSLANEFTLAQFVQYAEQLKNVKGVRPEELNDFILIGTIYRFKGLEREIGYVVGLSDGLLPHAYATGDAAPKTDGLPLPNTSSVWDERNVAFVAITRAKQECHLSGVATWPTSKHELQPSRFLYEMEMIKPEAVEDHRLVEAEESQPDDIRMV